MVKSQHSDEWVLRLSSESNCINCGTTVFMYMFTLRITQEIVISQGDMLRYDAIHGANSTCADQSAY